MAIKVMSIDKSGPQAGKDPIVFYAIGHVENACNELAAPDVIKALPSQIILDPSYEDALLGLEPGQDIMVLFYLHHSERYELQQHPRGDRSKPLRGVFALRSPQRPNPIGVTEVRLISITGNTLTVQGLDAINGTPVLDIKPVNRMPVN